MRNLILNYMLKKFLWTIRNFSKILHKTCSYFEHNCYNIFEFTETCNCNRLLLKENYIFSQRLKEKKSYALLIYFSLSCPKAVYDSTWSNEEPYCETNCSDSTWSNLLYHRVITVSEVSRWLYFISSPSWNEYFISRMENATSWTLLSFRVYHSISFQSGTTFKENYHILPQSSMLFTLPVSIYVASDNGTSLLSHIKTD